MLMILKKLSPIYVLTDIFDSCKEPKIVGLRLLSLLQLSAFQLSESFEEI